MDAPPEHESLDAWLDVARRLRDVGLRAPQVLAADLDHGYLLIEDLGTRLFLPELDEHSVDGLYHQAIDSLLTMQREVSVVGLPDYDAQRLRAELQLLPDWFFARHLGVELGDGEVQLLEQAFDVLIDNALSQPQVFVHRDFHSRNLLVMSSNGPGIIDFQDAVRGPLCYDLVSLLRDCYVAWPRQRILGWLDHYRSQCLARGGVALDAATLQRDFDWVGLQRHLKVLGIFARLHFRDGKSGYLADLPRVMAYVRTVCAEHGEFAALGALLDKHSADRDLSSPRE